jgi:3-isopropylmalate/(R)-2-methylmalate dehydratase small subunit
MEPFATLTSSVIPLAIKDVDTDLIIPAQFLTSISREGFGPNLFRRLRDTDPSFALNKPEYKGSQILVADSNFGCGSSREHAVWALQDAGFRAVICTSFADIFYNNSAKNGLLLVTLPDSIVNRLLQESAKAVISVTIDLSAQTVHLPWRETVSFEFDPFRRHCLLNGLDDIEYIRSHKTDIDHFRQRQQDAVPLPVTAG